LLVRALLPILLLALSTTIGCNRGPQRQIIGQWQEAGEHGAEMRFFPDGTLTFRNAGIETTGSYSFPDSTHLKVHAAQDLIVFDMQLSDDTLILKTSAFGKKARSLKRVH
jgi:hypothetical protein